jgi:DNA-binding response OmpR family regulator
VKILVVDDERAVRESLGRALELEGYDVELAADGGEALYRLESQQPDAVILDVLMPGVDGLEVARRVRKTGNRVPLLMLTAREAVQDRVAGLDAGADDYVTKPFRLAEFLARVRALLRRGSTETSMAQGVRVDTEARRAWLGDTELDLTTKEFDLLSVLVNEAGKVVTREQIMREVWDSKWWGSTKTLDMHISWLRRKLGDDAQSPRYITTVRGVGFRFERGD